MNFFPVTLSPLQRSTFLWLQNSFYLSLHPVPSLSFPVLSEISLDLLYLFCRSFWDHTHPFLGFMTVSSSKGVSGSVIGSIPGLSRPHTIFPIVWGFSFIGSLSYRLTSLPFFKTSSVFNLLLLKFSSFRFLELIFMCPYIHAFFQSFDVFFPKSPLHLDEINSTSLAGDSFSILTSMVLHFSAVRHCFQPFPFYPFRFNCSFSWSCLHSFLHLPRLDFKAFSRFLVFFFLSVEVSHLNLF